MLFAIAYVILVVPLQSKCGADTPRLTFCLTKF